MLCAGIHAEEKWIILLQKSELAEEERLLDTSHLSYVCVHVSNVVMFSD